MTSAQTSSAVTPSLGLTYARGEILSSTEDDYVKVRNAWRMVREMRSEAGVGAVFNFSGLERGLHIPTEDLSVCDDEMAPALFIDRLTELALEHLGGAASEHDIFVLNRLTGATLVMHMVCVQPGDTVVGVTAGHSHPSVPRAAAFVGAEFVDVQTAEELREVFATRDRVGLVVLTRLAVTYDCMPLDALAEIVEVAHSHDVLVYLDDAGGARVGPAIFSQPRALELGVDVAATGLDKYGTSGPRVGLLGGRKEIVAKIRARAFEYALEARPMLYPAIAASLDGYDPGAVRASVACTMEVGEALERRLGSRVRKTPVTAQLLAEDILEIAVERSGGDASAAVAYEASAALSMLLLRDYGVLTVHFAGLPPGTSALLIKFLPPDELLRFGGPERLAEAIDSSLTQLAGVIGNREALRELFFGAAAATPSPHVARNGKK
jgi:L-seryl-tRNA(Ser) seleniumtransferase